MSVPVSLYALENELVLWADTLDMVPADAPERAEVETRVAEYLGAAVAKRDRFAEFLYHLDGLEIACKTEESRLAERRRRIAKLRSDLEFYAIRAMEAVGRTKLEGNLHTMKLRTLPTAVVILDEAAVPDAYMRMPPAPAPVPDKGAIKKAIEAGIDVPGCDLRIGAVKLVRE